MTPTMNFHSPTAPHEGGSPGTARGGSHLSSRSALPCGWKKHLFWLRVTLVLQVLIGIGRFICPRPLIGIANLVLAVLGWSKGRSPFGLRFFFLSFFAITLALSDTFWLVVRFTGPYGTSWLQPEHYWRPLYPAAVVGDQQSKREAEKGGDFRIEQLPAQWRIYLELACSSASPIVCILSAWLSWNLYKCFLAETAVETEPFLNFNAHLLSYGGAGADEQMGGAGNPGGGSSGYYGGSGRSTGGGRGAEQSQQQQLQGGGMTSAAGREYYSPHYQGEYGGHLLDGSGDATSSPGGGGGSVVSLHHHRDLGFTPFSGQGRRLGSADPSQDEVVAGR